MDIVDVWDVLHALHLKMSLQHEMLFCRPSGTGQPTLETWAVPEAAILQGSYSDQQPLSGKVLWGSAQDTFSWFFVPIRLIRAA